MMINPEEVNACMGGENMMNHFKSDDIWIVKLAVKKMIQLLTKYRKKFGLRVAVTHFEPFFLPVIKCSKMRP